MPGSTSTTTAPVVPTLVTSTPRNAVGPTWTLDDGFPLSIWSPMDFTVAIGMANPCVVSCAKAKCELPAVSMPITCPAASTNGPPESPAWIGASVWIIPIRCSTLPESSSAAVIDWPSLVTVPETALGVPPLPPALPMATTAWPTLAGALAKETVRRCDAPVICSTATSAVTS